MAHEEQQYCYNQKMDCNGAPMIKKSEQGVTVDECPRCRGIFLDRGELPMIIATVSSQPGYTPLPPAHLQQRRAQHGHGGHHHRSSSDGIFGDFF